VGWAIEPRKIQIAEAEAVDSAEGNMGGADIARRCRSAVVEDPITHEGSTSEPESFDERVVRVCAIQTRQDVKLLCYLMQSAVTKLHTIMWFIFYREKVTGARPDRRERYSRRRPPDAARRALRCRNWPTATTAAFPPCAAPRAPPDLYLDRRQQETS
jgi:hypothetical protein